MGKQITLSRKQNFRSNDFLVYKELSVKTFLHECPVRMFDRTPFDRMPFDRKFILPKGQMTDFFSENGHLTESTVSKKMTFDRKKIGQKVV
jgi:hypothetical protein